MAWFVPVVEKTRDAQLDTEKKACFLDMELPMREHREASFDGDMTAGNKKLFAARVE